MKYRDFSEMPDDKLRAFANALAETARKAEEKARKRRRVPVVPSHNQGSPHE